MEHALFHVPSLDNIVVSEVSRFSRELCKIWVSSQRYYRLEARYKLPLPINFFDCNFGWALDSGFAAYNCEFRQQHSLMHFYRLQPGGNDRPEDTIKK